MRIIGGCLISMVVDGVRKQLLLDVPLFHLFDFEGERWSCKAICFSMNFQKAMVLDVSLFEFDGGRWSLKAIAFGYSFIWFSASRMKTICISMNFQRAMDVSLFHFEDGTWSFKGMFSRFIHLILIVEDGIWKQWGLDLCLFDFDGRRFSSREICFGRFLRNISGLSWFHHLVEWFLKIDIVCVLFCKVC